MGGVCISAFKASALKLLALVCLYLLSFFISKYNLMTFHSISELICVFLAWTILLFAINTHQYSQNNFILFLGIAYAFVGAITILHVLAQGEMDVFAMDSEGPGLSIQFLTTANFVEAASIMAAPVFLQKPVPLKKISLFYFAGLTLILLSIFYWQVFPDCHIPGHGPTPFKLYADLLIMAMVLTALAMIFLNRDKFSSIMVFRRLSLAYSATMASLLLFFLGRNSEFVSMTGQYMKFLSFYCIYRALIQSNLNLPYQQLSQVNARLQEEVSQREAAEAKRSRYEQELSKLSRLNSLAIMAGGLAHDFKNVLTIICGNAGLARIQNDTEKIRNALAQIESAARQGTEMANDLLSLTRDGKIKRKAFELSNLVRETVEMTLSGTSVKFSLKIQEGQDYTVFADSCQIRQVVNNISLNAVQAMPGGGRLSVKLRQGPLKEDLPIPQGNYISIDFIDQGTGIAEEAIENIFDPFFTTREEGHGLGLATSFAIVRNHGGYITVHSRLGTGATFTIYLPTAAICREAAAAKENT